jgi:transposase-like protein
MVESLSVFERGELDKHETPVDLPLTARCDLGAVKRFFRAAMKDEPLLSPGKIGTEGANVYPAAIKDGVEERFSAPPSRIASQGIGRA